MTVDIVVPMLGESVTEAIVAKWFKTEGEAVAQDEPVVELETDKVALEVPAPQAGTLAEIVADAGATVEIGALLGRIAEGAGAAAPAKPQPKAAEPAPPPPAAAPVPPPATQKAPPPSEVALSPAVKKLVAEHNLDPAAIPGTGKGARITKGDVLAVIERGAETKPALPAEISPEKRIERVPMTRLRLRIAERLKAAQTTAAILTTYNEADMSQVMALRSEYRESFETKHGVKLGFMSFFVKACITALQEIPEVNAEIEGTDIVYKNYYNIGVAVGTPQGLVVPVVRDADRISFAGIEKKINALGRAARDGKLTLDDLTGGTFTISNGGVYGSLMSSPILNPPQSGILGMHKIQERPVVVNGTIEARPMMYLALSYDHRLVDGREAVTFLVRVKDCIEDPQRMLLDL